MVEVLCYENPPEQLNVKLNDKMFDLTFIK